MSKPISERLIYLLVICALVPSFSLSGQQNIKFSNISIKDGLSQSSPNCIFQDSFGLLWIGTEDGLNKFDGYDFTVFKPLANDASSISNSRILCIAEDESGNLWIGTNGGGLNIYSRKDNRFFTTTEEDSPGKIIYCIKSVNNSELWIGSENGLTILDRETVKKKDIQSANSKLVTLNIPVHAIMQEGENVWIGTESGLYLCNLENSFLTHYLNPKSQTHNRITALLKDRFGNILVGSEAGLAVFDEENDSFSEIALAMNHERSNHVKAILEDNEGQIWIATFGNGLFIGSVQANDFINYTYDHLNPYSIRNNEVLSLFRDNSGLIWAGSNGIDVYSPGKEKFRLYDYVPYTEEQAVFRNIHPIYLDQKGILWVGSKTDGLHILDRSEEKYTKLSVSKGLSSNRIRAVKEFPERIMWVGTEDKGLDKLYIDDNGRVTKVKNFSHKAGESNSLTSNKIYALFADINGKLWIGTDNGLTIMDTEKEEFVQYLPDTSNNKTVSNGTVYAIFGDSKNNIWLATDFGINVYEPSTEQFMHFVHDEKMPQSLIHNEILCFHEDRKGNIWIGTYGKGFDKYYTEGKRFVHFPRIGEFSTAVVYGILEDRHGFLWMSTNNGLLRFNEQSGEIKQFSIEDGLQSNEFNGTSYFMSNTGEMFFGGQYGFNSFYPDDVRIDTTRPKIVLSELLIHSQPVIPGEHSPIRQQINVADEIVINHRQNNITLYFSALHYANPQRNQYKYKLEGFDRDWIEAGSKRFVSYTNLPYKTYRFRVIASNSDGIWNETGLSVKIKVKPPIWATFWFKIFMALMVVGLLYQLIRNKLKSEQKQKNLLEEKIRASTEKLNDAQRQLEEQRMEIVVQKRELSAREKDQENLIWYNQGLGLLSEIISKNRENISGLCLKFIEKLVEYVDAQQGGIFLLSENEEDPFLELAADYAFSASRKNQKFHIGEGYVGTCFKEKKFIEIDNLSENYSRFSSGLGSIHIKHLVVAPMVVDENCIGVLELGSFRKIKGYRMSFISKIAETFASTIYAEHANSKLKRFYEENSRQNRELAENEEKLRKNLEELLSAQEESSRREDELIKLAEESATREEMLNQEIMTLKDQIAQITQQPSEN